MPHQVTLYSTLVSSYLSRWFASWSEDQALLEYAFASPVLVTLVIASMEFGTIMLTSILMESRLREAARFGIIEARALGSIRHKQEAWRVVPDIGTLETIPSLMRGMQAEVFIMNTERTVLDYLLDPLFRSINRAGRES